MKKNITIHCILLIACCFLFLDMNAQRTCGSQAYLQQQLQSDPLMQQRRDGLEMFTSDLFLISCARISNATITIPVVFHILHHGEPIGSGLNISEARILEQLKVLNDDFARLNADAVATPMDFLPVAANTRIQFCLAQRDPNCGVTGGIIRKFTSRPSFSTNDDIKRDITDGSDPWPTGQYLNIWVSALSGGLLGYAQFPMGPAATDGVVLLADAVGGPMAPGTAAPYHLGRTATHEVGHWLNLYHIWGDDCGMGNGLCATPAECVGTDEVADTPNQCEMQYGCPAGVQTDGCTSTAPGIMYMNYMDYTDDACMNMFTQGQANRMYATFNYFFSPRASLFASSGCIPPVTVGNNLTLWAQDTQEDIGNEPNVESGNVMWASEDVWVRRLDDNGLIHQNPRGDTLNFIYVRVRNSSCSAWSGATQVRVNWAKASTGLDWPVNWDGSLTSPALMGDEVSSSPQSIPTIPPGGAVIVKFPWFPPNPNDYNMVAEPWHFCLLAHIGIPHISETSSVYDNVKNNNNIIWRNISISNSPVGMVMRNPSNTPATKRLAFDVPSDEAADPIFNHTDITVRLSNSLYNIWDNGGKAGTNITELPDHSIKINSVGATIDSLELPGQAIYRFAVDIHHTGITMPNRAYNLDAIQYDLQQAQPEGGERIAITSCTLEEPEVPNPNPIVTGTHPTCGSGANGTASIDNIGYASVLWAGPGFTSNLLDISGLAAGTYSVTATMPSGSTSTALITLVQPPTQVLNLSTGRSADSQSLLTAPALDPKWILTQHPGVTLPGPVNASVVTPHQGWMFAPTGAAWIANDFTMGPFSWEQGVWVYQTSFMIPQEGYHQLDLIFGADDYCEISFNGTVVGGNVYPGYNFPTHVAVTDPNLFIVGMNTLEFRVSNLQNTAHGIVVSANLTSCDSASGIVGTASPSSTAFANVAIHPNPTSDVLHITGLPSHERVGYTIMDAQGRSLVTGNVHDIDVHALPLGMYFLQLQSKQGFHTLRFVKQ